MIGLLLLLVLMLVILASWITLMKDCKNFNVSGPRLLPIVGNGHLFLIKSREFLPLLHKLKEEHGDAYRVHLCHKAYVILSHPKYIEPILTSSELITKGRSYDFLKPWLGDGLLTSTGHKWRTTRKFLTPAFHFNILQNYLPIFLKNEKILIKKLQNYTDGRTFDTFPIIALTALDNVTESIMGVSFDAQNNSESKYVKSIESLAKILTMRMRNPLLAKDAIFNLFKYKKIQDKATETIHMHTNKVISLRREELKKLNITNINEISEIGIKNKHAFLDLLLLSEVDGKNISDDRVREEVDTFMFEGHDTTTSGIAFALYCLSKHPEIQEKILKEQKDIIGEKLDRDPTYTELQQMKYLEIVIKESLRIYPSVPAIERMVTNDIEISGLKLKKGVSIIVNIFEMHRHPDLYENPLEFNPERFNSASANSSKNAFSWLAFSAGPRNCIGQKFAMMEMKVTIASIIRNFILLPVEMDDLGLCEELVLRSEEGVPIKLKPRPILTSSELITKGRSYDFLKPWLGDGLLTSTGHKWRTTRKFLTPAFHFNILQNYLPVFLKNEKILIKKLQNYTDGRTFDTFPIIALTALDNVTESIMGVSFDAQNNSESKYVKSIESLAKILMMRMRNPLLAEDAIFNLFKYKRIQDKATETLHMQTNKVISLRQEELKKLNITNLNEISEIGIKNKLAFLDLLLLSEVDGKNISDERVREEVDTFMFEGHDTTTSGIAFALYCLSKHPEIQEKILKEQKDIIGDKLDRDPTYTELQQMKYLEVVIRESLRLYPSVPIIERMVTNDIEIGGLKMRKGVSVNVNIFEMHRHPDLYENPLEFNPERFNSASANTSKNAFSWLAFSAGPRNCIGQKFAMMEMKVTIASIIRNFILIPVEKDDLGLCAELILRSEDGVPIRLQPRVKEY